jgi:SAM-dependent methyltransferase
VADRTLDPDALGYLEHWEPVLAEAAGHTLDRLSPAPGELLDLGAGTGSLTLLALRRWPATRVLALDGSTAMLGVARARVAERDAERVTWLPADAAELPLEDARVDAVASSFMLQIVADRPTVLAEIRRVLRPGGMLSFVTWLADDLALPADATYHDVFGDLEDDDEEDDDAFPASRAGDYVSLEQARDELAGAGLEVVEVIGDELEHAWTPESYLEFKVGYDDRERVESLDPARREQLLATLRQRLSQLAPEDFAVRGPLVAAVARRPAD